MNNEPRTVCVVDDDLYVREALESLLRSVGHIVRTYPSAEAFLGSSVEAACLVVDVSMPGMGGPELQAALVARGSTAPIIFMTARIEARLRAQVLTAGAHAVLEKPVDHERLLDEVASVMR